MRIGIPDLDQFSPQRGIGRYATTLVRYWRDWGHEVTSVSAREVSFPVLRNCRWGLLGDLDKVDVLFLPNYAGAELIYFLRKSKPVIVTVHDIGLIDSKADKAANTILTTMAVRFALLATSHAQATIVPSSFTKERLIAYDHRFAPKVHIVHHGVDHDRFFPRSRSESRESLRQHGFDLSIEDFVLLYVGAEYRRKNLEILVEALRILRQRCPRAKLLKVGSAHARDQRARTLVAIEEAGLVIGRDVILAENVAESVLAEVYGAADVYVSASEYEGWNLPVLEAMACGLPLVVSNASSFPEQAGPAAVYADLYDPQAFATKLMELAQNPPPRPVQQSLHMAAAFSWERTAQDTLQLLSALSQL